MHWQARPGGFGTWWRLFVRGRLWIFRMAPKQSRGTPQAFCETRRCSLPTTTRDKPLCDRHWRHSPNRSDGMRSDSGSTRGPSTPRPPRCAPPAAQSREPRECRAAGTSAKLLRRRRHVPLPNRECCSRAAAAIPGRAGRQPNQPSPLLSMSAPLRPKSAATAPVDGAGNNSRFPACERRDLRTRGTPSTPANSLVFYECPGPVATYAKPVRLRRRRHAGAAATASAPLRPARTADGVPPRQLTRRRHAERLGRAVRAEHACPSRGAPLRVTRSREPRARRVPATCGKPACVRQRRHGAPNTRRLPAAGRRRRPGHVNLHASCGWARLTDHFLVARPILKLPAPGARSNTVIVFFVMRRCTR